MRGRVLVVLMCALMLSVPLQGGVVSAEGAADDPRQPTENQTTLFLYSNGQSTHWSHFNATVPDNNAQDGVLTEQKDTGLIDIDYRFSMNPTLAKRLNMTVDGEVRVILSLYLEGDWTNDGNGACSNNECEGLNVTVWAGATEVTRQYQATSQGWQTININHRITEELSLWDSAQANPSIQIQMKLKGNREDGFIPGTIVGEPANFTLSLSGNESDTRVIMPIDESSWATEFQVNDTMPTNEDQPGFLLATAVGAVMMAAVYRNRSEDGEDSIE